jgi:hypothetical protein
MGAFFSVNRAEYPGGPTTEELAYLSDEEVFEIFYYLLSSIPEGDRERKLFELLHLDSRSRRILISKMKSSSRLMNIVPIRFSRKKTVLNLDMYKLTRWLVVYFYAGELSEIDYLENIKEIYKYQNLIRLTIPCQTPEEFEFSAFPKLRTLKIGYIKNTNLLSGLLNLESLEIGFLGLGEYRITHLPSLPNLKKLKLNDLNFQEIPRFDIFPKLESFSLKNCFVKYKSLRSLINLSNLKRLELIYISDYTQDENLEFELGTFLPSLKNLEKLKLRISRMDGDKVNASILEEMPNLKDIDICYSSIRSLKSLERVPRLTHLILKGNNFLDDPEKVATTLATLKERLGQNFKFERNY